MTLDYIGQELIWTLRCNNPYHKNNRTNTVNIIAHNEKENNEIVAFICKHIENKYIKNIIKQDNVWDTYGKQIVRKILIVTVFGEALGYSELNILNDVEISLDEVRKQIKERLKQL